MRPLVSSSIALVAVAVFGATLSGLSNRSEERRGESAHAPSGVPTPGFFAPPSRLLDMAATGRLGDRIRQERPEPHEFYFTRAKYSDRGLRGWGRRFRPAWSTDYPKGDIQFLVVIKRLVGLDAYDRDHAVSLADPEVRRYPFLYAVEVGHMALTKEEIHGLRDYLAAGGFLVVDDFWGTYEWQDFEYNIRQVLPGRDIEELSLDDELFKTFYDITEIKQVPNVSNARRGGPTWEQDGYVPHVLGIRDDKGRLMVVINWNTDLGDAWEWAEDPYYPLEYSTFAYEMGANMIVYGMSH